MRAALLLSALCLCLCVLSGVAVSNTLHETAVRTPPSAPRTLALLQSRALLQSHSAFFRQLTQRGHVLTYVVAGEESPRMDKYGVTLFDNLIVMAPAAEDLGEGASAEALTRFVDAGRSVLLVGGQSVAEPLREIATELGFSIDEEGTRVQDHGAFASDDAQAQQGGQHDLVRGSLTKRATSFVGEAASKAPVLFRGIGHSAQPSQLLTPLLTGSGSAFSAPLGQALTDYPASASSDVLLVSALQTRSNARVVFSGSVDLFSNELFYRRVQVGGEGDSVQSGNEAFVRELSAWVFQERGLLRARQLTHFKEGAEHDVNPGSYRVQDHIYFSVLLEEYSGSAHAWVPFTSPDVQLEFIMLDPAIRMPLVASPSGVHSARFQVPDVYGVYKFVVEYRRAGYSNLDVAAQVSVHPFRHDEFDRFIGQAYPYYTAAFTIMAAFFTFGIVFLYHKE